MKNTFSVIEKVELTLLAITFLMFMIGGTVMFIWDEIIGLYLMLPLFVCVGIILFLAFIFELILCRIWGLDLHIFPSMFKE